MALSTESACVSKAAPGSKVPQSVGAREVQSSLEIIKHALREYHVTGIMQSGDFDDLVDHLSVLMVRLGRVRSFGGDFASVDVSSQLAWLVHAAWGTTPC